LEIELEPDAPHMRLPRLPLDWTSSYRPEATRPVPKFFRELRSNVLYTEIPEGSAFERPIGVGPTLKVLGARHAAQVHPGYGFFCEVFFRMGVPAQGRWEAQIVGLSRDGKEAFRYTHPVAEGAWPQKRWNSREIIGDRVIVRPPRGLAEGEYKLAWQLVDRESGATMPNERPEGSPREGMVMIGEVTFSRSAPQGVAWGDSR